MGETILEILSRFYETILFVYGTTLLFAYILLAVLSLIAVKIYAKKNTYIDYEDIVASPLAPSITVIAPAFNKSLTIISSIRSLLTLNYPNFEIIIINNGSTDNTLEQMIEEFSLVKVEFAYNPKIKTQPIRGFYRSSNNAYYKLMVIDKVNCRNKADASNAGINAASFDYLVYTDVDSILEKGTLLKLIEPVMKEKTKRIIVTGATIRIANSFEFDEGLITRMRPPRQLLPRFQEVEYIRAFLLGKMGCSMLNSLPGISGGLELFDKEIVVKCGGYDHRSFGKNMELITRMCRYSSDNKIDYAVKYIPITLCWKEAPVSVKDFMEQRTRWARGHAQLMFAHIKMLFNPRYGRMGMIIFPYNFFFELLAPIVEVLGISYFIIAAVSGVIAWQYALLLIVFVYTYTIMITTLAILWDQLTFRYYKSWKEVAYLCLTPFMELFIYHPLVFIFSLRGYYYFITDKNMPGKQIRTRS